MKRDVLLERVARVAAQLARQPAAQGLTVQEVAADAIRLVTLGQRVRVKLENKRQLNGELKSFRETAERYDASVIENMDLDGCVLALKFRNGLYSSGYRNRFYVI